MDNEIFSRELKQEPLVVSTTQVISKIEINKYQIIATYSALKKLPDDTSLPTETFYVSRPRIGADKAATDLVQALVALFETWRQENEAQAIAEKAAIEAEALRWASLTLEQKNAEVQAARDAARAAAEADPKDPTPEGP